MFWRASELFSEEPISPWRTPRRPPRGPRAKPQRSPPGAPKSAAFRAAPSPPRRCQPTPPLPVGPIPAAAAAGLPPAAMLMAVPAPTPQEAGAAAAAAATAAFRHMSAAAQCPTRAAAPARTPSWRATYVSSVLEARTAPIIWPEFAEVCARSVRRRIPRKSARVTLNATRPRRRRRHETPSSRKRRPRREGALHAHWRARRSAFSRAPPTHATRPP